MIDDVLNALRQNGITDIAKNGYVVLPKSRCFAAWRVVHKSAGGADGYAMYWKVAYEVRICYRDNRTADDEEREKTLENAFRGLEDLECDYEYNSDDKLDITTYSFSDIVEF